MNALLARGCANYAGCLRLKPTCPGVLQQASVVVAVAAAPSLAGSSWSRPVRPPFLLTLPARNAVPQVIPQLRQVFERLSLSSLSAKALASSGGGADAGCAGGGVAAEADARLEHFKRTAWPRLKEGASAGGQLVYVPSYFDFVRCAGPWAG